MLLRILVFFVKVNLFLATLFGYKAVEVDKMSQKNILFTRLFLNDN